MEQSLRILILEDSVVDFKLVEKELEGIRPSLSFARVENRNDFLNELITSRPDVILSDYSLPLFDGMAAMRLAKQYQPDVPFIIVTGAIDEETAVICLKSGAEDYVLKSHLGRLGPAVESAIRKKQAMEEKAKTEEALQESEKRYRRLFESAQQAVLLLDSETGNVTDINPFGLQLIGRTKPQVLGKSIFETGISSDPRLFERIQDKLRFSENISFEELTPASGESRGRDLEITCSRYMLDNRGIIHCSVRDITARRLAEEEKVKMQAQLFQAQKMEAIGAVAGGVAHDFNNLMTAIQISTDLAMMRIDESHELFRELKEIRNSAMRATGLIRQLLLFSRKHPMEFRTLDLNPIIDNLLGMLHRLIGEDIEIKADLDPTLQPVRADASNMEQVIMNFVLNGRDAMPNGGLVTIRTANVELGELDCRKLSGLKPGRYQCLSVSDTGVGMDAETLDHIFEPFFTTKAPGRGTGLGLSVVYGIVKQHEGAIAVQSEPMKGSTFSVFLPTAAAQGETRAESKSSVVEYAGRGQTILLVEDEDKVRESAAKAMIKCGYRVVIACNVKSAKEMISREKGRFDLVFTDVVLSDRTGIDLAEEILLEYPNMKILLCSGYTDQKSQWPIIREKGFRFLQKPYDLGSLLRAIHEALEGKQ
jgi:two-component system, cell cycle sensor histidine kinase and response regulator CckA